MLKASAAAAGAAAVPLSVEMFVAAAELATVDAAMRGAAAAGGTGGSAIGSVSPGGALSLLLFSP